MFTVHEKTLKTVADISKPQCQINNKHNLPPCQNVCQVHPYKDIHSKVDITTESPQTIPFVQPTF